MQFPLAGISPCTFFFFNFIMYIRGWILIVNINRPYSKNVSAQVIKTDVSREKGFDI